LALLKKLATQYPGATAPKRLSLDVALGDEFKTLAEAYIWIGLQRGVPSLFVDIKSLYKNDEKRAIVEELVEAFLPKLKPEHELKETKPGKPATNLRQQSLVFMFHSYQRGNNARATYDLPLGALLPRATLFLLR
jgi:peptide alpha-N-acetyltransferase